MQISYGKTNTYDHSGLINNPPNIDVFPYLKKVEQQKKILMKHILVYIKNLKKNKKIQINICGD